MPRFASFTARRREHKEPQSGIDQIQLTLKIFGDSKQKFQKRELKVVVVRCHDIDDYFLIQSKMKDVVEHCRGTWSSTRFKRKSIRGI